VEAVQGSSDDEGVLMRALEGAESLFLVVPPSFTTNNAREYYLQFARPAARAIEKRGVKRVVAVSTLGRGLPSRSWTGQGGVAVLGPEDLSINEMVSIMTDVLGTPIRYVQVTGEEYKAQLMQFGASEVFAQRLVTMHEAKDNGLDNAEPRTRENTTPTSFRQWCSEVLKPAFLSA
jgi:uncharacterized protein YbjT (DUF2867 family)